MNTQLNQFLNYINTIKESLQKEKKVAEILESESSVLKIFDEIIDTANLIEEKAKKSNYQINYLNQFRSHFDKIYSSLQSAGHQIENFIPGDEYWRNQIRNAIDKNSNRLKTLHDQLNFNLEFFKKIEFFNSNVVAIGANGSGKTTLSDKFKSHLQNNGVVISAQRILLVPTFDYISNPKKTASELRETQIRDKSNKKNNEFRHLSEEFSVVLKNLLADNITAGNNYRKKAMELAKKDEKIEDPKYTNLDITFEIWNSLIEHRIIECEDGINITARSENGKPYPAIQMSDGEKVMLYLIAQVLQAPPQGFIVVDEPEMYLHKTVLKKLWDILEAQRDDCLFIYLTHDLDFATSRTTAKKIWIKSFSHPNDWEIEDIPTEEIPETLLFELLGSRKNILFCEGLKGSNDERVFSILFPELTIMPVGGCFDVINHTKAFNKLNNVNTTALGLIDSDHHDPDRLSKLQKHKIYSFDVAEVENLFLDGDFLNLLAEQFLVDKEKIEIIKKEVIQELDKLKYIQASNYVSTKVNYYFTDSDVSKGNELIELQRNYQEFLDKVSIPDWHDERIKKLNEIIDSQDYSNAIMIFNNKGIKRIASKHLQITEFTDRSIKILQNQKEAKEVLFRYFPSELKTAGNKI